MADWRNMEAGRALDQVIAERLGYEVKTYGDLRVLYVAGRIEGWDRWTKNTSEVPKFSTDWNTIKILLDDMGNEWGVVIMQANDTKYARLFRDLTPGRNYIEEMGKLVPEAAWKAWLRWKERKEND